MAGERVLLVDDDPRISRFVADLLARHGYAPVCATDAIEARTCLAAEEFPLVLLDVQMPGPSGLELLEELAARSPSVATIMVTGRDDPDLVDTTLELGAYGYITKPFAASELLHNLANAAKRRELELARHGERDRLADELERRTVSLLDALARLQRSQREVSASREELNRRLFHALELRDHETAMHAERVSGAAALVAERIGLTADHCARIRIASMLHDVGKLAVPDRILRKPGPLTAEERAMVEYHTELGRELLSGSGDEVLEVAAAVAWAHHERYDGTGYPRGLQGAAIPLEARIVAVADVFDALLGERPYRGALELPHALELMAKGRRIWFDPDPLDALLDSIDDVLAIRGQHPESPTRTQGG